MFLSSLHIFRPMIRPSQLKAGTLEAHMHVSDRQTRLYTPAGAKKKTKKKLAILIHSDISLTLQLLLNRIIAYTQIVLRCKTNV